MVFLRQESLSADSSLWISGEGIKSLKLLKIRKEISNSKNMPPCNIFNNREAELLVINKPTTKAEFVGVKGFKEKRYEMFGEEIIKIFKNS